MKTYTIALTKQEARLCRDAAKAEGESLLLDHGAITLNRGEWLTVIDWLDWHLGNVDDCQTQEQLVRLANRIHGIVGARFADTEEATTGPAPGCLF